MSLGNDSRCYLDFYGSSYTAHWFLGQDFFRGKGVAFDFLNNQISFEGEEKRDKGGGGDDEPVSGGGGGLSGGAIAGIVIAVIVVLAGGGFGYYKCKQGGAERYTKLPGT